MEGIRPFETKDIAPVSALHQRVFDIALTPDLGRRYRKYFTDKFLEPVGGGALPSLVFENVNGEIEGFIAVATRAFLMDQKRVVAAVSSQFIVSPRARSQLVGVALLRSFLNGRQELSFTDEANEISRKLWEKLGGFTASSYSTHWIAPLRPANLLLSKASGRLGVLARLATPVANLIDAAALRIPGRAKLPVPSEFHAEPLHVPMLTDFIAHSMDSIQLRPCYDSDSAVRLFGETARGNPNGELQGVLLRRSDGRVAGWYFYCLNRGGVAEVLQVGCRQEHETAVINHLVTHAFVAGATALAGRLEPHLRRALSSRFCVLSRRAYSMLIHSRNPQIVNAIHSGKAFISRLEGEWCLRFH